MNFMGVGEIWLAKNCFILKKKPISNLERGEFYIDSVFFPYSNNSYYK